MARVLITGITGRSGTYFLEELIAKGNIEGNTYRAIIRNTSNTSLIDSCNLPIEKFIGDLDDEQSLKDATNGMDTVLHIAGISQSLKLVKAAVENNVKKLILVHTTGIYSKYKSAGADYLEIEKQITELISEKNIPLTVLRPTMIYGSLKDYNICIFIKMVDKFRLFPVVSHARFALQPVHQKDLGIAYYNVLANPQITENKDYILSGSYPINLIDILKTISDCLGKKTMFMSVPYRIAYTGACVVYYLTLTKIDYREKVQRLVEPRAYSHDNATKDFGYSPMDFKEGLKQEVEEYIKIKNIKK